MFDEQYFQDAYASALQETNMVFRWFSCSCYVRSHSQLIWSW
jgi:hypothetical protein